MNIRSHKYHKTQAEQNINHVHSALDMYGIAEDNCLNLREGNYTLSLKFHDNSRLYYSYLSHKVYATH